MDSLSIKDRNNLNIPKGPIISTELLSKYIVKTSWEITPLQLDDRDLVFTKMHGGMFTSSIFDLMPREEYAQGNYIPSYLNLNFRERKGKQYLLEIDFKHTGFYPDREIIISRGNEYQVYDVINDKVHVIWESNSDDNINLRITQKLPSAMVDWETHRFSTKIKSIKIVKSNIKISQRVYILLIGRNSKSCML